MKRELSPKIPIAVVIATFGVRLMAVRGIVRNDPRGGWGVLIILGPFTAVPLWLILTHKDVSIDDQYLYVRSRKDEIQIPLSEMKKVHYSVLRKSVVITLKSPTPFGQRISFHEEPRPGLIMEPEIVDELNEIIDSLKNKTIESRATKSLQ